MYSLPLQLIGGTEDGISPGGLGCKGQYRNNGRCVPGVDQPAPLVPSLPSPCKVSPLSAEVPLHMKQYPSPAILLSVQDTSRPNFTLRPRPSPRPPSFTQHHRRLSTGSQLITLLIPISAVVHPGSYPYSSINPRQSLLHGAVRVPRSSLPPPSPSSSFTLAHLLQRPPAPHPTSVN